MSAHQADVRKRRTGAGESPSVNREYESATLVGSRGWGAAHETESPAGMGLSMDYGSQLGAGN